MKYSKITEDHDLGSYRSLNTHMQQCRLTDVKSNFPLTVSFPTTGTGGGMTGPTSV